MAEAVRRLTPEQQLARKRRQFRAFDISLKKTPLPDHIQAVQDPFEVGRQTSAVLLNALLALSSVACDFARFLYWCRCCACGGGRGVLFHAVYLACKLNLDEALSLVLVLRGGLN